MFKKKIMKICSSIPSTFFKDDPGMEFSMHCSLARSPLDVHGRGVPGPEPEEPEEPDGPDGGFSQILP
jgi:hypothetical protein